MRRILLLLGVLLLLARPSQAAIAFVASASAGSSDNTNVTTGAINSTGANLLVCATSSYDPTTKPVLTDSKSNSWNERTTYHSSDSRVILYWAVAGTVGSSHTFTLTGASSYPSLACAAFSGADAAPYDVEVGNSASGATSLQPGSHTPSVNNEVVIEGLTFADVNTIAINGGFTLTTQTNFSGGNHFGVALAYLIQTTATAANPTWSWSTTTQAAAAAATFKENGGGGGGSTRPCCLTGVF